MGDVKSWSVTYTKHVKQKRKVYQDGILHLLSNNKVMLYDETDQLLDSRFLTKDEAVKSGESLAFASFLVDIGDLESNPNSTSHPNPKSGYDYRTPKKTQDKLRNTFVSKGKPNTTEKKPSAINISPSQKIIREFKKNEVLKYGAQQSPPSTTTSSFKEWEALYTTQVTQKAKKYHDGYLRVMTTGCQGRQVILCDSSKSQLEKRFLKKDEVICCGESLKFDAYLVDVGDAIRSDEHDADVKICRRNLNVAEKAETFAGRQWHNSFVGQSQQDTGLGKRVHSNLGKLEADKMKLGNSVPSRVHLREAHQILSILKKPISLGNISITGDTPVKQHFSQSSSEVVQLDIRHQEFEGSLPVDQHPVRKAAEKCEDEKTEGYSRTCSEGKGPQSPSKRHPIQASVDHGKSVILQSPKDFMGGLSSVSNEPGTHHDQSCMALPETNRASKELTSSIFEMSGPKCSTDDPGDMNSVKAKNSDNTHDYPSFDLGF